jgi:hypothetical protein
MNTAAQHSMKTVTYYLDKASRLARLPQSKNVRRKMTANHRAMGDARQRYLAAAMSER